MKSPMSTIRSRIDRKVAQRLDANRPGRVVVQECRARELRLAVHRHAAAAADAHAARPAVRERAVDLVLDVIEAVEYDPLLVTGHLVLVERRLRLLFRTIPRYLQRDAVRACAMRPPHKRARQAASG